MRESLPFEPFRPHPLLRNGHLQTVAATLLKPPQSALTPLPHFVDLGDGDQLVLHDDVPEHWKLGDPLAVLIHGLGGSHQAGYMLRIANRLVQQGIRTFRVDMRGCGLGMQLSAKLNHAGRSDDIFQAIQFAHRLSPHSPIAAVGVSLGGNQLLKLLGEWGAGLLPSDSGLERLVAAIAVAPPVDLTACSKHMQSWHMKPYNQYFIKSLLRHIPSKVQQSEAFQQLDLSRRPATLFELDDRITAPVSGFNGAADYYQQSSSLHTLPQIPIPTLVIASRDDPIVPLRSLVNAQWAAQTTLEVTPGGGHVAFLSTARNRHWLDRRIEHALQHIGYDASNKPTDCSSLCPNIIPCLQRETLPK